ncbi:MAG: tRNA pseudouridine(55) synthase TruB, partial [Planctomycetota bacterium]|nr:tRNA pseudouridine(55) synthase TruB [Planctomycetota bacterium]
MFGFLNIHKPKGKTSRDAVNHIQRMVRPIKVGHGGTLDPLATGVLVVAMGPATRLIEYVQAQPKTYRGTFRLGESSNTEDLEGEIKVLTEP